MASLDKLETTLDEVFNKKAPYQLPPNAKRGLAGALWWLALIGGVLQLWAAWSFWRTAHTVNQLVDWANSLSSVYGTSAEIDHLGPFFYLSVTVLAVSGVILLLAVPQLKNFSKSGWNLLFYGALLNAVYGVVRTFSEYGGGVGVLLWALVSSAIGAYFLFQVRSHFLGKHADHKPAAK